MMTYEPCGRLFVGMLIRFAVQCKIAQLPKIRQHIGRYGKEGIVYYRVTVISVSKVVCISHRIPSTFTSVFTF